jgi:uncharacterized membrane protein HdeD (DUF308 family)
MSDVGQGPDVARNPLQRVAWQALLFIGVATLVLGIIIAVHPSTSLDVIAVLIGVATLVCGVFQLIRALDASAEHRIFWALAGLAFVVIGVLLIRHLHLTKTLIALYIGLVWILQGVAELAAGVSNRSRLGQGFAVVYGIVSLAAGIVVVAWPSTSLVTLAVLIGIWFAVIGALQIVGAFAMRSTSKAA